MMSGSDFIRIISSLRVYFRRKKPQHSINHSLLFNLWIGYTKPLTDLSIR